MKLPGLDSQTLAPAFEQLFLEGHANELREALVDLGALEAALRAAADAVARSMLAGGANATATWAVAQILAYSFSRVGRSSFLESSSPRGTRAGSRITAAATTGPASGPRPASSQPATGQMPRLSAARSRRKVGRTGSSPSGRRAADSRTGFLAVRFMPRWCPDALVSQRLVAAGPSPCEKGGELAAP